MTLDNKPKDPPVEERWKEYFIWNDLLTSYFFEGKFKDRPVYLEVTDKLLEQLGKDRGLYSKNFPNSFKSSIKNSLSNKTYFNEHLLKARRWRFGNQNSAPPFIALLSFFSYVAEKMVMDEQYHVNNYYGRMLKELTLPNSSSTGLQSSFRSTSLVLWDYLNEWIDSWDGEIGIKTAKSLDSRWYVSTAISQALIRENDRNLLRKIFDERGLTPGQKITADQMLSILLDWSSSPTHVNSALTKLINGSSELRSKVLEIACSELELWDGKLFGLEKHVERGKKLFCIANIRKSYPKYKLDILLCTYVSSAECGSYRLVNTSSLEAKFAFEAVADDIRIEWQPQFDAGSLEPYERIPLGQLLLGSLKLCSDDSDVLLSRNGSPLCILNFRKEIGSYYESPRAALGQESLMLVHKSINDKINSALLRIARPGFSILTTSQVNGLPEDWYIYKDVQVIKAVEIPGIEALTPLVNNALELVGGICLGHNTWLRAAPPEILITYETSEKLTVIITLASTPDEQITPIEINFQGGLKFIKLDHFKLLDGSYQISIFLGENKNEPILFSTFRLGSSDSIRLLRSGSQLAHFMSNPSDLGAITASISSSSNSDEIIVKGMYFDAKSYFEIDYLCLDLSNSGPSQLKIVEEESFDRTFQTNSEVKKLNIAEVERLYKAYKSSDSSNKAESLSQLLMDGSCISVGRHLVVFTPNASGLSMGICKGCGLTLWRRFSSRNTSGAPRVFQIRKIDIDKPSLKYEKAEQKRDATQLLTGNSGGGGESKNFKSDAEIIGINPGALEPISTQIFQNTDTAVQIANLIDSICYVRQGAFEVFANIVRISISSDPWLPSELLRKLASLGHIDVQYDLDTLKPRSWRVCDPTLTECKGELIFSGWRSRRFISRLELIANQLGNGLMLNVDENGFPVIKVMGIKSSEIQIFAKIVSEDSDFPLLSSINFTEKLLTALPVLSQVKNRLPSIELPYEDMDYFDTSLGKWLKKQKPTKAGAYRLNKFGVHYYYLPQEYEKARDVFHADSRLVKYLACQSEFGRYYVYDEQEQKLSVPIGMELPYLYERVAISCAGFLPVKNKGYLTYSAIPPEVAEGLAYKLFSE